MNRNPCLVLGALVFTLGCGADDPSCDAAEFGEDCTPVTQCGGAEFETAAPTATTDRQCAPLTACAPEEFEATAPTETSDRACALPKTCSEAEFETAPPTSTSDRQCASVTVCTSDEFEGAPPTATQDRVCTPLTVCDEDEIERTPATATTDRVCIEIQDPLVFAANFGAAYQTETAFGFPYSPLVIDADGTLTVAGHRIDYIVDIEDRVTWSDQTILGNVTTGTIDFSVEEDGLLVVEGSVRPRAVDGPVSYDGFEEPLMELVGAYDTVTQFGYAYTPLVIDGGGNLTIAGDAIDFTFDPVAGRIEWQQQTVQGNVTVGNISFSGDSISGNVRPRAQDGFVNYSGEIQAVMDFVGTYDTITQFGFAYTPMVLTQSGTMRIAGDLVDFDFDGTSDTMTWEGQTIDGNVTAGDIDFFVEDDEDVFEGTIRPRAQDGPVSFTGESRN